MNLGKDSLDTTCKLVYTVCIMGNAEIQSRQMRTFAVRLPQWAWDDLAQYAKREAKRTGYPITSGGIGRKLVLDFLRGQRRNAADKN